jgi:hypothetical protein
METQIDSEKFQWERKIFNKIIGGNIFQKSGQEPMLSQ